MQRSPTKAVYVSVKGPKWSAEHDTGTKVSERTFVPFAVFF